MRDALAIARTEHLDLVITDILMPTMDGYQFVRLLRANPATAQYPSPERALPGSEAQQLAKSSGSLGQC